MISSINKATGETIEFETDTFEQIVSAYRAAQHYEKVAQDLKDQLKLLLPTYLNEQGKSKVTDEGYRFVQIESQRMNYNRMALRNVFDEDTLDLFMEVSKGKVDKYIKEHELTPAERYELKSGLEPAGNVIVSTKLEKIF